MKETVKNKPSINLIKINDSEESKNNLNLTVR